MSARAMAGALVCVSSLVAPPAWGQPMSAVRPLWSLALHDDPELVGFDGGFALALSAGRLVRVGVRDGVPAGQVVLPDCDASYPAATGRGFLVWDRIEGPSAHGLFVQCLGGTGRSPAHWAGAIDPATLAVRWRLDGGDAQVQPLAEHAGSVVLEISSTSGTRVSAVDAADGAVRWSTEVRDVPDSCRADLQDDDTVVLVGCHGAIVALDRATGRRRFRADAGDIRFARLVDGALVVAGDRAVRAFDTTTGRERWRLPAATPVQAVEPLGAGLVGVALHAADLVAVELATGAVRWRAPVGGAQSLEVSGERVAVAIPDALVILARADGRELRRFSLSGTLGALRWSGDSLVGIEQAPIVDERLSTGHLVVLDLATGALRRHSRALAAGSPLVTIGDLALGCSESGVVHAADVRTGRGQWRAFVGRAGNVDAVTFPCRLFASEPDGVVLALGADHVLSAFDVRAPRGGAPARARVVVAGEVVAPGSPAGIRVLVGDVWTRTDEAGHFEVALRGAGRVTAQVDPRDATARCAWSAPVTAVLRGRPRLRLRVERDHCVCHDCD